MTARPLVWKRLGRPRPATGAIVASLIAACAPALAALDGGWAHRAWPLAAGALFGIALQRGELSLVRAWRDLLALRDGRQLAGLAAGIAFAAALTLGGLITAGATAPPPGARIAPVSWLLCAAAFLFGVGSVIARGSLMVHLRRLGEGSLVAVPALLATFLGVTAAIAVWPLAWDAAIGAAPALWLPDMLGLPATLALQLTALGIAFTLFRRFRPAVAAEPMGLAERLLIEPWAPLPAALLVGAIAAACYAAGEPLGLTGECAAVARRLATFIGLVPTTLPGLDQGVGGLVVPLRGFAFSGHVVIVTGVIAGAFAAALSSGRFSIAGMTVREAAEMAAGGLLIGFGGMLALGTVTGAAISGVAVGAVSGWVFLAFASLGVVTALALDSRTEVAASQLERGGVSEAA